MAAYLAGVSLVLADEARQNVGLREEEDKIQPVSLMHYDIGCFELDACRMEPVDNPFGPKVLSMSPV